jgi:hypothetical protein
MANKNQDPISQEDMSTYLNYLLTGEVKDDKHAKDLRKLSRRTVTLSDVTVLVKVMMQHQDKTITQLMDAVQIQSRVLEKLGATDEIFEAAQKDYNKVIADMQKELEAKQKEVEEAVAKVEE